MFSSGFTLSGGAGHVNERWQSWWARKFADNGWIGYGPKGEDSHYVYLCPPHNGKPAAPANGSMLAFKAATQLWDGTVLVTGGGEGKGGSNSTDLIQP